ncbi:hypothetical protein BIU87_20720 [Streptomyces sp. ZS0098]|uniref:hypothetical protein n=1 Tax=Streptomyces sp. ZS0098 TaxID=1904044 RepID=UPI000EFD46E5|nr:hypothetical protein [Streptomyces sp. ZS0098]RMI92030.1 hypothetical protein BIU87_20720 [Streptomyces sp. ZS0098]
MTPKRYTASTITDDALDALYDNANRGWRRGDEWKQRALAAEAALARLTAWCDQLDATARRVTRDPAAEHPVAANVRHQMAKHEENTSK